MVSQIANLSIFFVMLQNTKGCFRVVENLGSLSAGCMICS